MKVITDLWSVITKNPLALIIVAVVFVALTLGYVTLRLKKKPSQNEVKKDKSLGKPQIITGDATKKEVELAAIKVVLGTGNFKCMAIRSAKVLGLAPGTNVIDFTTMPEPIGEVHIADTSCPISGGIYTVREMDNGEVVDWDPRETPMNVEETPEYAWFATHWEVVAQVFSVPVRWWASTSIWFAVGCLAILFFVSLTALGG